MDTLRTATPTARLSPLECVGYQVRYTSLGGQPDRMLIADQARAHELARHHRGTVSACVLLSDVIAERQQMAELVAELERTITAMRLTIDQRRAAIEAKRYPTGHHQHTDDHDDRAELDRLLGTLPGDDQQDDAFAQRDHARQMSRGSMY